FAGWLVAEAVSAIAQRWPKLSLISALAVMLIVLVTIVVEHAPNVPREVTLQDQDQEAQVLAGYLGSDDKIYAHGMGEVLVLLNRPNLNKYLALNSGADDYIAAKKPGGFQDVIDEIEMYAPKIVVMTRMRNVRHSKELWDWVEKHYNKLEFASLKGVYV